MNSEMMKMMKEFDSAEMNKQLDSLGLSPSDVRARAAPACAVLFRVSSGGCELLTWKAVQSIVCLTCIATVCVRLPVGRAPCCPVARRLLVNSWRREKLCQLAASPCVSPHRMDGPR